MNYALTRSLPLLAAAIALWTSSSFAADKPTSIPAMSQAMQKFIEAKEVAGTVTLIADPNRILHLEADGLADVDSGRKMTPETIFWIASMTKPVTGAAVMRMQDAGKLSVDDAVSKYLPEFKNLKTKDGKPATITIRHLLTHTSGMAEISSQQARTAKTLADVIPLYLEKPLLFEPGSRWNYCQSSINTAARIVEVVSGESYPEFLEKHFFKPLGMKDTTFYLSEDQHQRLATSYRRTEKGELERADNIILNGHAPTSRDRFPAANGGLFSTAPDYVRFCQMILNGGSFDGREYLKAESVKLMTTIQTGDLKTGFTEGNGWGLGWCVVREPQGVTAKLSPGTHGHGGAYGTQAWIDPQARRIYLLMVQRSNFPNADNSDIRKSLHEIGVAELPTK